MTRRIDDSINGNTSAGMVKEQVTVKKDSKIVLFHFNNGGIQLIEVN